MADSKATEMVQLGSEAWNQWRKKKPHILPDLRNANLQGKTLTGINFGRTSLDGADLRNANLRSASFESASLSQADLSGAKLRDVWLHRTFFKETRLQKTNFHHASLLETMFLNVDLSQAINLETAFHLGPSIIGVDTIQRSRGNIPDVFLRKAGVSEQLLACIRSSGQAPFDYATCFISYSSQDQHFVDKLHQDLRKEGVVCWYAPANLKAGEKFQESITNAVQSQEKLLVVLSESSVESKWVAIEVALARRRESNGKRSVLVPIYLDSAALYSSIDWVTSLRKHRHMRSFENWQQSSCYQKRLGGLLNDLRKR